MSGSSAPRVVVVGGGILGASTAVHLARAGADVELVTAGELADGASGRSLAWLNAFGPYSSDYHGLRVRGLEAWGKLAAGTELPIRLDGGLRWVSEERRAELRSTMADLDERGYPVEWVDRDDVRRRMPGVDPDAVPEEGAAFAPGEGWVDLPSVVAHLVREVEARGGTVRTGCGPVDVVVEGGRASGVSTPSGGRVEGDAVVLATGPAVPSLLASLGVDVPDGTTPGLVVRTAPLADRPAVVLNTPRAAVRPDVDGGLVVDAGWAERETTRAADGSYVASDDTVRRLLAEASRLLAGNPTLEARSIGVGPKPIPGDGESVVGPVPGLEGCHVVFTHSGATLGLVLGEQLAAEVLDPSRPSPALASFRPDRFTSA